MTLEELYSNQCVGRHFKTGLGLEKDGLWLMADKGFIAAVARAASALRKTLVGGRLGALDADRDMRKGTFKIYRIYRSGESDMRDLNAEQH